MRRTIGGEFEIDPGSFRLINTSEPTPMDGFWYASGRSALYHIISHSKLYYNTKRILLPEWLCSSMVDAVQLTGIDFCYYALDQNFLPDLNSLSIEEGDLIVVVNYFGLQNIEPTIIQLKTAYPQLIVVSDLVQAYFEMKKESCADYRYTSLRKTFAVPDGGWALSPRHNDLEQPTSNNYFSEHKLTGAVLKFEALATGWIDDHQFLQAFEAGENMMSQGYAIDATVSKKSLLLFQTYDKDRFASLRRQNARYIVEELAKIGIKPLITAASDNCVPLFVPIAVDDNKKLRQSLANNGIYCPVHWPSVEGASMSNTMFAKELSLVVDQRYNTKDMTRIIEIIKQCL